MVATQAPVPSYFFADRGDATTSQGFSIPGHDSAQENEQKPSTPKVPLFFEDDDDDEPSSLNCDVPPPSSPSGYSSNPDHDADILVSDHPFPQASTSARTKSTLVPETSSHGSPISIDEPQSKKRKIEQKSEKQLDFTVMYLGSFIVDRAWSTARGKGYTKIGDVVLVERDSLEDTSQKKATSKTKSSAKDSKSKGGKKQLSIATMLKPPPPKTTKKKKDTLVRLTNKSGFGQFVPSSSRPSFEIKHQFIQSLAAFHKRLLPGYQGYSIWVRQLSIRNPTRCIYSV